MKNSRNAKARPRRSRRVAAAIAVILVAFTTVGIQRLNRPPEIHVPMQALPSPNGYDLLVTAGPMPRSRIAVIMEVWSKLARSAYRAEHGRDPAGLTDLAPGYLTAVPLDLLGVNEPNHD
jgi:hypothetical protein